MKIPPYPEYPKMASERLLLRKIKAEEISEVVPISFYDGKQAKTKAEAAEMFERIEKDYLQGESIHWGIEELSLGRIAGTCGFYRGIKHASGELGCVLLPEHRGQGIMTEAMKLAVAFGFRKIGLKRIFAVTSKDNVPAIKLLERLNFSRIEKAGEDLHFELLRINCPPRD